MPIRNNLKGITLLTGTSHPTLAKTVGDILHLPVHQAVRQVFSDGEIQVQITDNVRRKHVFIIQSLCRPYVNRSIIELELIIQAAKLASADEITVVLPYFGYSRQDRKDQPRVPISAAWTAQKIALAGADRFCTIDIHNEATEGVVRNIPWDNLYASYSFIPIIRSLKLPRLIIASPDSGGLKRAIKYSELLGLGENVVVVSKHRDSSVKERSKVIGLDMGVKGKDIIIIDDITSTGGTIVEPARIMKEMGARSVRAFVTHGLLVGNAQKTVNASVLDEIYITDSVPTPEWVVGHPRIRVVSIAPLLAGAIKRIESGESISNEFILHLHLGRKSHKK